MLMVLIKIAILNPKGVQVYAHTHIHMSKKEIRSVVIVLSFQETSVRSEVRLLVLLFFPLAYYYNTKHNQQNIFISCFAVLWQ